MTRTRTPSSHRPYSLLLSRSYALPTVRPHTLTAVSPSPLFLCLFPFLLHAPCNSSLKPFFALPTRSLLALYVTSVLSHNPSPPPPLLSSLLCPPFAAQEGAMAMADAIPMGLRDGRSLLLLSLLPSLPRTAYLSPLSYQQSAFFPLPLLYGLTRLSTALLYCPAYTSPLWSALFGV